LKKYFCEANTQPKIKGGFVGVDCSLLRGNYKVAIVGKHAGPLEEEMIATFFISGPGISKKEIKQARIVDMVPTVLALMGVPFDPTQMDGKPIIELSE
jgi:predicted AlkP superfamily phosphohydrolase/phosphomutase